MELNEEFLNNSNNHVEIKVDLLKWLSSVFDTYEGDYYFPWNNIDNWMNYKQTKDLFVSSERLYFLSTLDISNGSFI